MWSVAEFWRSGAARRYSSRFKVNLCKFVVIVSTSDFTVFLVLECVDMDGLVRGLSGNEFVDRIPCDALDEITMLSDIADLIA